MTAQRSIQIKRFFWFIVSLVLCLCTTGSIALYLLQQRAIFALDELSLISFNHQQPASSNSQIRHMKYLLNWLDIKKQIIADEKQAWLAASTEIFRQILLQKNVKPSKLAEDCKNCREEVLKSLLQADQYIQEIQQLEKRVTYLSELSERLKQEIEQKLKFHILLSKDFESLVGSPSLYTDASKNEIMYFVSGPFKWLPLLDTTKVNRSKSTEVADFSGKLESLRDQSKNIVDEYLALKNKDKVNNSEQSVIQNQLDQAKNSVLKSITSAWGSELTFR